MKRWKWNELAPIVSYANFLRCEPGFTFGPRVISSHQFIFVAKGEGKAVVDDNEYSASEGDLFYYGPNIVHFFQADSVRPFELVGVHFEPKAELSLAYETPFVVGVPLHSRLSDERNEWVIGDRGLEELRIGDYVGQVGKDVAELFMRMVENHLLASDMAFVWNRGLFLHALSLLHKQTRAERAKLSPQDAVVRRLTEQLTLKADDEYDRSWLKAWSGYNEDYVSRLFVDKVGLSPHRYHQSRKIERAKELLAYTDLTVTEIADGLRFGSIHYFSKTFRSAVGLPPAQYRMSRRFV